MKKKFRIVFLIMTTFSTIIAIIYALGVIVRPTNVDVNINAIATFEDLPENSIDVIGYGSSHLWRGFVPEVLDVNYGINSYNYGCDSLGINTIKFFLQNSLKTQSPDIILIETYLVNKVTYEEMEVYYTTAMDWSLEKCEFLYDCYGGDIGSYLSYIFLLFSFHENWTDLSMKSFFLNYDSTNFIESKGYMQVNSIAEQEPPNLSRFTQESIGSEAYDELNEIVSICKLNDIDIIFYTAPYSGEYKFSDAMSTYAKENDCTYLNLFDYLDELEINWETDFYDKGHTNISGATKISDFLGEYISSNYDVVEQR